MIKIEFPAGRDDIAVAIGEALIKIGTEMTASTPAIDDVEQPIAPAEPENEYEQLIAPYVFTDHMKAYAVKLGRAVGLYEQKAMNQGDDPLPLDEIFERLKAANLLDFSDANVILDNITKVTAGKPKAADPASATDDQGPTEPSSKTAGPTSASDAQKTDEKGVAFDPAFCSKAAQPFYGSGKKKGQWKKRQGVDEDLYDEWYAGELLKHTVTEQEPEPEQFNAGAVFGQQPTENPPPASSITTVGELMVWVSEQTAAGNLPKETAVTDAFTALELPMDGLLNPEHDIAGNCARVHEYLLGRIQ